MPKRRRPHPAYWEYLYICIAVTTVCGVILLFAGSTAGGVALLAVTGAEAVIVLMYRRRSQRK